MSLQRTSISWLMFAGLKLVPKRSARPRFFVFALSSSWSKLMPVMPSIVTERRAQVSTLLLIFEIGLRLTHLKYAHPTTTMQPASLAPLSPSEADLVSPLAAAAAGATSASTASPSAISLDTALSRRLDGSARAKKLAAGGIAAGQHNGDTAIHAAASSAQIEIVR